MDNKPANPLSDKKDNTLYIKAVDSEGYSVVLRTTFPFS